MIVLVLMVVMKGQGTEILYSSSENSDGPTSDHESQPVLKKAHTTK